MPDREFTAALAAARILLDGPAPPRRADAEVDQLDAAITENWLQVGNWDSQLRASTGSAHMTIHSSFANPDGRAYLLAAVLSADRRCRHVTNPTAAVLNLPFRTMHCLECFPTVEPPADEADRCDLCGERGVKWFQPIALLIGPITVIGNICPDCAKVLAPANCG